jgi:hypothetical protein
VKRTVVTYGLSPQANLRVVDVQPRGFGSAFRLIYQGEDIGLFRIPTPPGEHNVRNAAAAIAVGLHLNLPVDLIRTGLEQFGGVGRRFDVKGTYGGVTLIDDYAHHPAEIRSTLEAARHCGFKRLLVLFQPHRYSRTKALWDDFCHAFNQADILVITDIYSAGEKPLCCVTGARLAASILDGGQQHTIYMQSMQEAIEELYRMACPGDAVMALGAGSVGRALEQLALLLGSKVVLCQSGIFSATSERSCILIPCLRNLPPWELEATPTGSSFGVATAFLKLSGCWTIPEFRTAFSVVGRICWLPMVNCPGWCCSFLLLEAESRSPTISPLWMPQRIWGAWSHFARVITWAEWKALSVCPEALEGPCA